jgi:hypothetical protein
MNETPVLDNSEMAEFGSQIDFVNNALITELNIQVALRSISSLINFG